MLILLSFKKNELNEAPNDRALAWINSLSIYYKLIDKTYTILKFVPVYHSSYRITSNDVAFEIKFAGSAN